MTQAPAAPVRRLAPLGVGVLAAHFALLQAPVEVVAPMQPTGIRFASRTIEAPTAPAATILAPTEAPVPAPRIAPRPRRPADTPAVTEPARRPASTPVITNLRRRSTDTPVVKEPAPLVGAPPSATEALQPAPATAPAAANPESVAAPASPATLPLVVQVPPPARFRYEVLATYRGLPLQGEGEISWRHDGQAYEMEMELRSLVAGNRRQRSTGRITDQGLVPEHFHERTRSEQATHFDRDGGRVTFSNNRPAAAWLAGMQDRLSVVLQLAVIIGGQPERYPAGTQLALPTASTREADIWIFSVEGEDELQLPGGAVRALKLQRNPRREYDIKVELWLSPRQDYAPVRLRLTNPNGDTVDQRWSSTDKG